MNDVSIILLVFGATIAFITVALPAVDVLIPDSWRARIKANSVRVLEWTQNTTLANLIPSLDSPRAVSWIKILKIVALFVGYLLARFVSYGAVHNVVPVLESLRWRVGELLAMMISAVLSGLLLRFWGMKLVLPTRPLLSTVLCFAVALATWQISTWIFRASHPWPVLLWLEGPNTLERWTTMLGIGSQVTLSFVLFAVSAFAALSGAFLALLILALYGARAFVTCSVYITNRVSAHSSGPLIAIGRLLGFASLLAGALWKGMGSD